MNNTLIKGLRLLEALAREGDSMGVTELAAVADMPKSGAHRLLQALVAEHYVGRRRNGNYAASMKLWELGSATMLGFDLRQQAVAVMEDLMEATGESVHLSILDGMQVVYVHKVESPQPVRSYSQIGGRAPAHCVATGKAMMAFKSREWLEEATCHLDPATTHTIANPEVFLAHMDEVRCCGFAMNFGEWRAHVNGLAAPIFNEGGSVIAAIGISGLAQQLNARLMEEFAPRVREAARRLSVDGSDVAPYASLLNVLKHWTPLANRPG